MEANDNEKWVVEATVPDEVYTDRAEFLDYFYEAALKASRRWTMSTVLLGLRRMGKTVIFNPGKVVFRLKSENELPRLKKWHVLTKITPFAILPAYRGMRPWPM